MNIELTENSYIYQSAKRLLNRELEKCTKLLKENEEAWNEYMDLKLHDAFTTNVDFEYHDAKVSFTDEQQSEWFNSFCYDQYELLMDWCREQGIEFNKLRDDVGQTSKFYLGILHNNENKKYLEALCEAIDTNSSWINLTEENGVVVYDERATIDGFKLYEKEFDIEQVVNDMLGYVETAYDDLNNKLEDIIKVYQYIEDVKANQVELFKEYVREQWLSLV